MMAALFAVGCAAGQHPRGDAGCQDAIRALAALHLDRWHGLPRCGARDFDLALGARAKEWQGSYGRMREYSTANGLLSTELVAGHPSWVLLHPPELSGADVVAVLGPPEERAPSRLFEPFYQQWIYAKRGLTVHVDVRSHEKPALQRVGRI